MNAGVDETHSDPTGIARKWSASSKASHLWIFPVVLVRILEWIFKEPCFLKLVWEARKAELAAEARLVWLWHVEMIRHCGDANISEACECRWMEWILSPYNTTTVLVRVQRRMCRYKACMLEVRQQQMEQPHSARRRNAMKKNEVFLKLWGLGERRWTMCLRQYC